MLSRRQELQPRKSCHSAPQFYLASANCGRPWQCIMNHSAQVNQLRPHSSFEQGLDGQSIITHLSFPSQLSTIPIQVSHIHCLPSNPIANSLPARPSQRLSHLINFSDLSITETQGQKLPTPLWPKQADPAPAHMEHANARRWLGSKYAYFQGLSPLSSH